MGALFFFLAVIYIAGLTYIGTSFKKAFDKELRTFNAKNYTALDDPFNLTCDQDNFEHLTRIVSEYRHTEHDRGFKIQCRKGFVSRDCHWAYGAYDGFLNDWDKNLTFTCPDNHIITGIESEHDNYKEDRRWNFKCCMVILQFLAVFIT